MIKFKKNTYRLLRIKKEQRHNNQQRIISHKYITFLLNPPVWTSILYNIHRDKNKRMELLVE